MPMTIPAIAVVVTMDAELHEQMEVIQSNVVIEPRFMFALVLIFCLVARMLVLRKSRQAMSQNGSHLLWFAVFYVGIGMGLMELILLNLIQAS